MISNYDPHIKYVALIGDIVRSRDIDARADFQQRLTQVIDKLNLGWENKGYVAPVELSQGDEIQALFSKPAEIMPVLLSLSDQLYPQRFLFGLGRGHLTTGKFKTTVAMDGPCFHRAREALKVGGRKDSWLVAKGFGEPFDELITAHFRFLGVLRASWTNRQQAYVSSARHLKQYEVAQKFKVVPSVVSESLRAANFFTITQGETALMHFLELFGKKGEFNLGSVKKANLT